MDIVKKAQEVGLSSLSTPELLRLRGKLRNELEARKNTSKEELEFEKAKQIIQEYLMKTIEYEFHALGSRDHPYKLKNFDTTIGTIITAYNLLNDKDFFK